MNTQNVGKWKVYEGKTFENLFLQFVGKNVGKFMKKVGKKVYILIMSKSCLILILVMCFCNFSTDIQTVVLSEY